MENLDSHVPDWIDKNDLETQFLYTKFIEVISRYTNDLNIADSLFKDIQKNYSAKNRHYHNMTHIYRMCNEWMRVRRILDNPDAVFFMIMYHDIIYKSRRVDNEQQSADYFIKDVAPKLNWNMTDEFVMDVNMGILVTKHDGMLDEVVKNNKDFQYLLDFDLEVLGANAPGVYEWYRKGVRKEYRIHPNILYKPGRKKVLESFLSREKIYLTKEFEIKEKYARKNLLDEINLYLC